MARPPQDAIDMFVSITGAPEAVALQKLEEHGGDLNVAVNAHFNEGHMVNTHVTPAPTAHNDLMDIDDPIDVDSSGPTLPLLAAARNLNPFSLLDSSFGRSFLDGSGVSGFQTSVPRVSHPKEVREIPIEFKDENIRPGSSSRGPKIEEVTGSISSHDPEIHGTVIIDDDDDENLPSAAPDHGTHISRDGSYGIGHGPSAPSAPLLDVSDNNNDIEEEMIKAAIEASKRDAESSAGPDPVQRSPALEDVEFARAVSLSLKTAEQEKVQRRQDVYIGEQSNSFAMEAEEVGEAIAENGRQELAFSKSEIPRQFGEQGVPSLQEEEEDVEEHSLIRHRSRRTAGNAESVEAGQVVDSPPLSPIGHGTNNPPQLNGDAIHRDEWGGISSEEHDEAVMLEAAMFGGIPEGAAYRFPYQPHPAPLIDSNGESSIYHRIPRQPSPTLTAQRLLREQQDDEYLAALQADREKELKAIQEAEAVREREKHQEEEIRRKQLEDEEFERKLAAKEASLPREPSADDENAMTLLVRMPDGSRRGRRFLKSDRLQLLFDFIDVGRLVKPGTYRLVRPYPRRAFTDKESELSLSELGLSSKQEALFIELI